VLLWGSLTPLLYINPLHNNKKPYTLAVYKPPPQQQKSKRKFRAATRKVPGISWTRRKKIYRNFSWSGHEFSRPSLELIG
jgi:hypothetical protein